MRFFMQWAYVARPWLLATCHKAIRNIRAYRELKWGDAAEEGMRLRSSQPSSDDGWYLSSREGRR